MKVIALGCRLNAYEARVIEKRNAGTGVVVNTCAVTSEAARQSRQKVRSLLRRYPDTPVYATGCAVEENPASFTAMGVQGVVGNGRKLTWKAFARSDDPLCMPPPGQNDVNEVELFDFHRRSRAFVEVQTGCDHACTFCIVRTLRGPSQSKEPRRIIEGILRAERLGFREVVLTGVDIASYAWEAEKKTMHLGELLGAILRHTHIDRIRLSSLDCKKFGPAFYGAIADTRVMPYFHLSLQSGDSHVLRRMGRRHTPEEAGMVLDAIRKTRKDAVFGADMIVGFPGEDEMRFRNTLRFLRSHPFVRLHVFPFSERPGTPAVRLSNAIPVPVRKRRASTMRRLGERLSIAHARAQDKTRQTVLIEGRRRGKTPGNAEVVLDSGYPMGEVKMVHLVWDEESAVLRGTHALA